jgi:7-carboxy-7-deazaguanine synthase
MTALTNQGRLPIIETFTSVQGEGIKTGIPTFFIRLAGCNFVSENHPCKWCDTIYSGQVDSPGVKWWTFDEIREDVSRKCMTPRVSEVCLTGGEPLYHNTKELIHWLSKFYKLTVQTNGSYPLWKMDGSWAMDIKCPSSGNTMYNIYDNIKQMSNKDCLKFVIQDRKDFEFARDLVCSTAVLTNVIFQPAWKLLKLSTLIKWVLNDRQVVAEHVRVGTQLHKVAYPNRKRGV